VSRCSLQLEKRYPAFCFLEHFPQTHSVKSKTFCSVKKVHLSSIISQMTYRQTSSCWPDCDAVSQPGFEVSRFR